MDPFEYPLLVDAMASSTVKKKKSGGALGRKTREQVMGNPGGVTQIEVLPTNLTSDFQKVAEKMANVDLNQDGPAEPHPSPPSVRYRSKSRGSRKEVASGSSVKKKIEKNKRSLSRNNRLLGVSDLLSTPQ